MRIAQVTVEESQHGNIQDITPRIGCQIPDGRRGDMPLEIKWPFSVEIKSYPDMDGIEDTNGQHRAYAEFREQGIEQKSANIRGNTDRNVTNEFFRPFQN